MRFAVLLGALVLVPIAGVAGYFAHQEPEMPGFGAFVSQELGLKHVPGQDSDDWVAAPISGPFKGQVAPVGDVFLVYPSQRSLEQQVGGKVKYFEVRCQNYSTGGDKALMFTSRNVIRRCAAKEKTRKQVARYVKAQLLSVS